MRRKSKRPSCERSRGVVRVLTLLRMLQGHRRYGLEELAVIFTVSVRTIRRDFDVLHRVGYPIVHEERGDGGNGYWWMIDGRQ